MFICRKDWRTSYWKRRWAVDKKKRIFREVVKVTRWQISEEGVERVTVVWNRVKQHSQMRINGILQWEMSEALAERFFYKYGLLTDLK